MTIGDELRRIRELRGISLRRVARDTGISPSTLSRLENGAMPPSPDDLAKLATVYKADYNGLMKSAGYLESSGQAASHRRLLVDLDVSEDEAKELLDYLEYIRWRRNKRQQQGFEIAQESGEYD